MAFLAAVPAAEGAAASVGAGAAAKGAAGKAGSKAAGGKAAARRAPAGGRRITADLTPDEVNAELQRRRQAAAARVSEPPAEPDEQPQPSATSSLSGGRLLADIRPSNAGGGFVLGTFVYVLGLTYLRSGREGVKAWLKAKFLNEVA